VTDTEGVSGIDKSERRWTFAAMSGNSIALLTQRSDRPLDEDIDTALRDTESDSFHAALNLDIAGGRFQKSL